MPTCRCAGERGSTRHRIRIPHEYVCLKPIMVVATYRKICIVHCMYNAAVGFALLRCRFAWGGNWLPIFQNIMASVFKGLAARGGDFPRSHLHRGGNLKFRNVKLFVAYFRVDSL
jgi:hypothetical protein